MLRRRLVPVLGGLLAVLAYTGAAALAAPQAQQEEAPACIDCHDDIAATFAGSAHGKVLAHKSTEANAACLSCHVGAEKHGSTGEAADIASPQHTKGAAADAACLTCHGNQKQHASWPGSAHEMAGVRCVDCHSVHAQKVERRGAKLLSTNDLCLSCHATSRAALSQRSHHPLREGRMTCVSCHNPHGTSAEKLIKADSVNDLCYTCHQEMRGPFLWEHSPVREDCQTCHSPHGSNHDKLLVARASQLCQSCHLQGRHQTVAGLDTTVWNSNRACLNCHSQIHGSNHPSGPLFQR